MLQLRAIYYHARTELLPLLGSESTLFAYNFMNFIILLSGVHKFVEIYIKPLHCVKPHAVIKEREIGRYSQRILMARVSTININ